MMNQSNLGDLLRWALEECDRLRAENAIPKHFFVVPNISPPGSTPRDCCLPSPGEQDS